MFWHFAIDSIRMPFLHTFHYYQRVLQQVAVFSDSQLRPAVERDVRVPNNWYINCTPGGTFLDVCIEMEEASKTSHLKVPSHVVIVVGTNDAARHMVMHCAERHLRTLLSSAIRSFPSSKVCTSQLSVPFLVYPIF